MKYTHFIILYFHVTVGLEAAGAKEEKFSSFYFSIKIHLTKVTNSERRQEVSVI